MVAPLQPTRLTIPSNRLWTVHAIISAWQYGGTSGTTGDCASFEIKTSIKNVAGTTSLVGASTINVIAQDAAASAWTVATVADDTNDSLQINVTGEANKSIHWIANIQISEAG